MTMSVEKRMLPVVVQKVNVRVMQTSRLKMLPKRTTQLIAAQEILNIQEVVSNTFTSIFESIPQWQVMFFKYEALICHNGMKGEETVEI